MAVSGPGGAGDATGQVLPLPLPIVSPFLLFESVQTARGVRVGSNELLGLVRGVDAARGGGCGPGQAPSMGWRVEARSVGLSLPGSVRLGPLLEITNNCNIIIIIIMKQ